MSDEGHGGPVPTGDAAAEVERLRSERDELRRELEETRRPRRRRLRRTTVALLVGLTSIGVILSTTVVWAHRTLLNTDVFVGTVGPAIERPGVATVVADRSTTELFAALDVQKRVRDALPPRIGFVAGPITNATESAVEGQLAKVISSDRFHQLWTDVLTQTHQQVLAVLRGQHSNLLTVTNGYIVLNTVPLINDALRQVSGLASNLTGHHVTLPTITSAELPHQAVDKLSTALGVRLPSDFGQITLVKAQNLSQLQRVVRAFDRVTILLPILTAALLALALWLSVARRRTLLQLVVVVALLTIVLRRVLIYEQGALSQTAKHPQVAHGVLGSLLSGIYDATQWILWAALVIVVVALVTGPYRWAVAARRYVRRGWDWLLGLATAERRAVVARWTAQHATVLQLAAAVVAFVLLLVVSISWVSFVVIGALLAVAEFALNAVKEEPPEGGAATGGPSSEPPQGVGASLRQPPAGGVSSPTTDHSHT